MKGKILKIKTGYNPNSSSIGADIVVFFSAGAALGVIFNAVAAVITAAKANAAQGMPLPEGAGPREGECSETSL